MRVGIFPYQPSWDPFQELFPSGLEAAGCDVVRIPSRKWFPLQHALRNDIDILHMDWPHDFYSGRTALRRMLKKAMYLHGLNLAKRRHLVWTAHNLVAHDAPDLAYEQLMIQRLITACSGVVCTSHAAETILRNSYDVPERTAVKVIPLPGHYVDWYPNTISRDDARARLGLGHSRRVVLSLGRLLPYKGLEELIGAFDGAATAGDALLLAGWAPRADFIAHLEKLAAPVRAAGKDVKIYGDAVPQDDVQIYYNACDVAAYPFRRILTSGSVMMAMSFGRCFVAPHMGSVPEVAPPNAYFGYDPDQDNGLRTALQQALQAPDLLERGAGARSHALERFSWLRAARLATDLYRDILGTGSDRLATRAA